jgi:aspartate aminotransferase
VAPEAAIYLTIKMDLAGKKTSDGAVLQDQAAVTAYLLEKAGLAIVPFYAFGADKASPWYRLSVGTCKEEEISKMLHQLREALADLT